jgi:hypothetical protein
MYEADLKSERYKDKLILFSVKREDVIAYVDGMAVSWGPTKKIAFEAAKRYIRFYLS